MKQNYLAVVDVGTAGVKTIIAQTLEDGQIKVTGVGQAPNNGMRRGLVVEIEEVASAIAKSIEKAELSAGVEVGQVYVAAGGVGLEFQPVKGVIAVGRADGEVTEADIERSLEAIDTSSLTINKEILHVIPQKFKLDDQEDILDPVGMQGVRLEMQGVVILAPSVNLKNLKKCFERNNLDIKETIAIPLAAARSALNKRQKELGSILIELGAGTTVLTVYEEQEIIDVKVLPVGMNHVTSDIAIGLRTSIEVAETVKLKYGSALPQEINKNDKINLADLDSNEEGLVSRRYVAEIIEARLEEIFQMVGQELKEIERDALLPAGAILSGGGAYLHGAVDLAKNILRLPAQIGFPADLIGLVDKIDSPMFNVGVGMLLLATDLEEQNLTVDRHSKITDKLNFLKKAKGLIGKFMP